MSRLPIGHGASIWTVGMGMGTGTGTYGMQLPVPRLVIVMDRGLIFIIYDGMRRAKWRERQRCMQAVPGMSDCCMTAGAAGTARFGVYAAVCIIMPC